ncbi:uncharacterized [Tachysurus ichikawai]
MLTAGEEKEGKHVEKPSALYREGFKAKSTNWKEPSGTTGCIRNVPLTYIPRLLETPSSDPCADTRSFTFRQVKRQHTTSTRLSCRYKKEQDRFCGVGDAQTNLKGRNSSWRERFCSPKGKSIKSARTNGPQKKTFCSALSSQRRENVGVRRARWPITSAPVDAS